ncbi:RNA polymerase sigma factor [Alteromonas sp. a30]|uniref:RNA polymerase sigma factor n=1 Tax=Alteromonas sp. a30 TaxID=2730917 RepID=UPI00227EB578|nr:RNA polymerase sigma factor [Alteromonas sp. a30]MCY7296457.1 RNA polymerase sigma factor [Alteromonas sp. a30]
MQTIALNTVTTAELDAAPAASNTTTIGEFNALITALRPQLLRYCLMYLRNPDEAEEACQDTLLKAYQSLHSFQGRSSLKTWIYKIAANVCATQYRKIQRQDGYVDASDAEDEESNIEQDWQLQSDDTFEADWDNNPTQDFNHIVSALSLQERNVLCFRFKNDLPLNDIAVVLSLNLSTVKMCYYRALEKVKLAKA